MSGLTQKQQRFVAEYLVDLHPVNAAIRAGYKHEQAARWAEKNLANPIVKQAVNAAKKQREERVQISQDSVISELAAIGFTTMGDLCHWNNGGLELVDSEALERAHLAAVAEITETTTSKGGTVKLKLHSKLKALELLAKHLQPEDNLQNGEKSNAGTEPKAAKAFSPELRERLDAIYNQAGK